MKDVLRRLRRKEIERKSSVACDKLVSLKEFQDARTVMIYLPMSQELDTSAIAAAAWESGKTVLAPKVDWDAGHMVAMEITSLVAGLSLSTKGPVIREPQGDKAHPLDQIDMVVVPALAFDASGNRLGRGKGFYDRFLAQPGMKAFACGIGFAEQLVDQVPTDANDRPVDAVATDDGVIRFG